MTALGPVASTCRPSVGSRCLTSRTSLPDSGSSNVLDVVRLTPICRKCRTEIDHPIFDARPDMRAHPIPTIKRVNYPLHSCMQHISDHEYWVDVRRLVQMRSSLCEKLTQALSLPRSGGDTEEILDWTFGGTLFGLPGTDE